MAKKKAVTSTNTASFPLQRQGHNQTRTKVGNAVLGRTLEHERQRISSIFRLEGDHVVISGALENFGQVTRVESEGERSVTSEVIESFGLEGNSHERNVRTVHGLDGELVFAAINVGILNQILDGLNDLLEHLSLYQTRFKHDELEGWMCG